MSTELIAHNSTQPSLCFVISAAERLSQCTFMLILGLEAENRRLSLGFDVVACTHESLQPTSFRLVICV